MRQYNHKGLLWRASETAEVASYELFLDLLYVGILAVAGDAAIGSANAKGFLQFAITFLMAWKLWSDVSQMLSWIVMDDVVRRISILFYMIILLGLVTNMGGFYENTYTTLVAFYITGRWYCGFYFIWMGYLMPMVQNAMISSAFFCFLSGPLWIGSIHVPDMGRQALIWPAIVVDILGPGFLIIVQTGIILNFHPSWKKKLQKVFDFVPGNNIEHKIDRTNAFVALVFGYSVVNIIYQSSVAFGINAYFGKAVLGLCQTFIFSWLYFELDVFNMHAHAIRRSFVSAFVWILTHLPFVLAFTLSAAALARLTVAHDTPGAEIDALDNSSQAKSEADINNAVWLFYCIGLGVSLACSAVIASSHRIKKIPDARLTKNRRIVFRFVVSIAICMMSFTRGHINSLKLVGSTCSLVFAVLWFELAGSACSGRSFWGLDCNDSKCTYSTHAKMSKKELEDKIHSGDVVDVEELARKTTRPGVNHDDLIM